MHEKHNEAQKSSCLMRWTLNIFDIAKQHLYLSVFVHGYLSVGQLNNGKLPACFAPTVCLRIERVRLHAFVLLNFDLAKEAQQMAKFARCPFAKTTANCSNSFCHFHLISSVSQPQRPLIFATSEYYAN